MLKIRLVKDAPGNMLVDTSHAYGTVTAPHWEWLSIFDDDSNIEKRR